MLVTSSIHSVPLRLSLASVLHFLVTIAIYWILNRISHYSAASALLLSSSDRGQHHTRVYLWIKENINSQSFSIRHWIAHARNICILSWFFTSSSASPSLFFFIFSSSTYFVRVRQAKTNDVRAHEYRGRHTLVVPCHHTRTASFLAINFP